MKHHASVCKLVLKIAKDGDESMRLGAGLFLDFMGCMYGQYKPGAYLVIAARSVNLPRDHVPREQYPWDTDPGYDRDVAAWEQERRFHQLEKEFCQIQAWFKGKDKKWHIEHLTENFLNNEYEL